jgi:tripartite-type tricarboxylate transporter receptor subunit TctC
MPLRLRWTALFLSSLCGVAAPASIGAAQTYPDHAIRMVVPYTPGGQFDIHARLLADKLKDLLGQPIVIENRPGGGTMIGAEAVAKSPNDGYTLLFAGANMFAILPQVYRKISYKVSDFQTISLVSDLPMGLMVSSRQLPVGDLKEFVSYVKARPGTINFGTSGTGGAQHLIGELANLRMGLNMTHISYRGTPEVLTGLLGDQIPVTFDGMTAYLPNAGVGKPLKSLGVSSPRRVEVAPDVPTFAELGYPEMTVSTHGGIVAPAGTPRPIIDKLHDAIVAANNDPQVRAAVVKGAAIPRSSTPEEFDAVIRSDSAIWGEVIRKLNISLD